MTTARASAAIACAALAVTACPSKKAAPIIDAFTADTNPLPKGSTETLRWTVRNADKLTIDSGVGDVTGKTSTTVAQLSPSTTYTLTATNADHPAGVTKTVTVKIVVNPAVVYFTATPSQVLAGMPVTYSWKVQNAVTVTLDGAGVTGNALVANATATATHLLAVTGAAGSTAPRPARTVVRIVAPPAISSFTATPASIAQGATTRLSWAGNGLGYSLDNGVGDVGALTYAVVRPTTTTTYTLTARGPAGSSVTATQQVTVTPTPGTRTLSYADPAGLPAGASLALVKNAASTPTLLKLDVVTTQAVSANALAFGLALDGSKVALDAAAAGDTAPGFTVNASALNPGSTPAAAAASLRTAGPLANVLTFGIAQKPSGGGAVPGDTSIPSGSVLCTLRLMPVATAAPGPVFPFTADGANPDPSDPYKPYQVRLRGNSSSSTLIALGTLTLN